MVIEGRGKVAPVAIRHLLSDTEMLCLLNQLPKIAGQYDHRTDTWGRGLLGEMTLGRQLQVPPSLVPSLAGKIGEHAVRARVPKHLRCIASDVDFEKHEYGDGGCDLVIGRVRLQVKARVKGNHVTNGFNLIRVKPNALGGEAHVFCQWLGGTERWATILGWLDNRSIATMKKEQSPRGNWMNWVIGDRELLPMNRLWAWVEGRQR